MKLQDGLKDNVHILVIGDIIVDRYITGTSTKMSFEAPIPILDYKNEELRLGGSGNVALNLKHLDSSCKVSLMGVVGDDYHGQWVVDELENYDIDNYFIHVDDSDITNCKTRYITGTSQMMRLDKSPQKTYHNLESIVLACDNIKFDMIIVSDYDYGVLNKDSIESLKQSAKCPIIVDPKLKNFWDYSGVYCIKPNRREITEALYYKLRKRTVDHNDIDSSLDSLIYEMNKYHKSQYIVVTDGDRGMCWYDSEDSSYSYLKGIPAKLVDVTGAGDTVISTLGYSLAKGYSFEKSLKYSNIAASRSVEQLGCGYVDFSGILSEIKGTYSKEGELWHQQELENIRV